MNSRNLLLLVAVLFSTTLFADFVPLKTAKKVALNFYYEKYNHYEGELTLNNLRIVATHTEFEDETPCYYVFHLNAGGFIIVSADNCLAPVLGYSFDQNFVFDNQPPNVQYWFGQYKDQVIYAIENDMVADADRLSKWQYYSSDTFQTITTNKEDGVGPLLTTLWDQGWPYNCMCPIGDDGQAITGCVATAYAQALYYWRFPLHGSGFHCYNHPVYGELCADFENTWYRWDEMCDAPQTVNTAIGELMYHAGVAVDMDYGVTSSGAWGFPEQIEPYFNISTDYDSIQRDLYSYNEWRDMILDQLNQNYVVLYIGFTQYPGGTGHFWVCDGFQDETYFHMNWGWGGSANGYFTLDNLQGFNTFQYIGINFYPDTINFEYPFYASGADTCLAMEGSIDDGSGPVDDYLDNTVASWLIDPQTEVDSVTNISLKIKRLDLYDDADRLYIYDGEDNSAPLLAELGGNELPDEMFSSSNKTFIEFITDSENTAGGFYLVYHAIQPDFCNGTTTITDESAVIGDGSLNFNYYNNAMCQWYLMPETDQPLTLIFNYFDTEEGHDFVEVYDLESQELLIRLSGTYETPPDPVTAESGQMLVAFMSNKSISQGGWEAWYDVATTVDETDMEASVTIAPNPVNHKATISYAIPQAADVHIYLFDAMGVKVKVVHAGQQEAGKHKINLDMLEMPPGVYLVQLDANKQQLTQKIVKL
jgi:hypothetical protein